MKISLVVAASDNHAIGKDNQLLWHLPKDMRFFKNTTWALPILMGRKTFESLGNKVLPGRMNIIITRQANKEYEGAKVVTSLEQAMELAKQNDYNELMVIGGGEIYQMAMPLANTIYLTRVHTSIDGDTYFPALGAEWMLESSEPQLADEKHAFNFDFEIWQRK
jgi:dihydrofolate reductase